MKCDAFSVPDKYEAQISSWLRYTTPDQMRSRYWLMIYVSETGFIAVAGICGRAAWPAIRFSRWWCASREACYRKARTWHVVTVNWTAVNEKIKNKKTKYLWKVSCSHRSRKCRCAFQVFRALVRLTAITKKCVTWNNPTYEGGDRLFFLPVPNGAVVQFSQIVLVRIELERQERRRAASSSRAQRPDRHWKRHLTIGNGEHWRAVIAKRQKTNLQSRFFSHWLTTIDLVLEWQSYRCSDRIYLLRLS